MLGEGPSAFSSDHPCARSRIPTADQDHGGDAACPCLSDSCSGHGTCSKEGTDGATCNCTAGYSGTYCQIVPGTCYSLPAGAILVFNPQYAVAQPLLSNDNCNGYSAFGLRNTHTQLH